MTIKSRKYRGEGDFRRVCRLLIESYRLVGIPIFVSRGEVDLQIHPRYRHIPVNRRRGLAKAMMREGLHRLKDLGAFMVYVGTGTNVAGNCLYKSVGFTDFDREYHWLKAF